MPNDLLASLAREEAERHPPRTPQRRAAAWLYVILSDTPSLDPARRALSGIPDQQTRYDATVLLRQLAEQASLGRPCRMTTLAEPPEPADRRTENPA